MREAGNETLQLCIVLWTGREVGASHMRKSKQDYYEPK